MCGIRSGATWCAFAVLLAAVVLRKLLDPVMGDTLPLVTLLRRGRGRRLASGYATATVVAVAGYALATTGSSRRAAV